nr:hypothetical protein [Enterovibrio nigricans]
MSNQYPNPVRGYVPCAHCGSTATVHCIGEGKLIATGETPKNKRNVGKQYYRCQVAAINIRPKNTWRKTVWKTKQISPQKPQ